MSSDARSATSEEELLAHVAAHAGASDDIEGVRAATHATLSVLGASCAPAIRELVADEFAPSLGAIVRRAEAGRALPIQEHIRTPDMAVARADELIASVFTVLGEELSDDAIMRLQRELPPTLARHVVRPVAACRDCAAPRVGETLADGRAGSRRPVSQARRDRTQPNSVADDNPHAAVKFASATGTTQEREHATLAEGSPGSSRPLAGARK